MSIPCRLRQDVRPVLQSLEAGYNKSPRVLGLSLPSSYRDSSFLSIFAFLNYAVFWITTSTLTFTPIRFMYSLKSSFLLLLLLSLLLFTCNVLPTPVSNYSGISMGGQTRRGGYLTTDGMNTIVDCRSVNDDIINALANNCPDIEQVDVLGTGLIHAESIMR